MKNSSRHYTIDNISRERLLKIKLKDLSLSLDKSFVFPLIKQVKKELLQKKIRAKVNFWVSDEWFSPDGVVGVAIPFYLMHKELIQLEREQIGYAEGETEEWCLRILRHEVGHALDNAYNLRRKRSRISIFGKSSVKYPSHYDFEPFSRNFVKNIGDGYAQAHPTEDFAETVAVWLDPESNWKSKYAGWPVIKKLDYVDSLFKELAGVSPAVTNVEEVHHLNELNITLENFYKKKRNNLDVEKSSYWDRHLNKLFAKIDKRVKAVKASQFISRHRKIIAKKVAPQTNIHQYRIDQMLDEIKSRSKELNLFVHKKEMDTINDLSYYLIKEAPKYIKLGKHLTAL